MTFDPLKSTARAPITRGTKPAGEDYARLADADAPGIDAEIEKYEATFLVDAEKRGLAAYHPHWDAYRSAYAEVLEAAAAGEPATATRVYFEKAAPLYGEVAAVAEQSSASAEEVSAATEQTSASAQEIAASAQSLATTSQELDSLVRRFNLTA